MPTTAIAPHGGPRGNDLPRPTSSHELSGNIESAVARMGGSYESTSSSSSSPPPPTSKSTSTPSYTTANAAKDKQPALNALLQPQPSSEETLDDKIARLGRQRPAQFPTLTREILCVFSICMSQLMTEFLVSGFPVILPVLLRDLELDHSSSSSASSASNVWPATAFSLVIAATLLVFGRLGDMWGGYPVFIWGLAWCCGWSVVAGFSVNPVMLVLCRALQGLGPAAYLPTGVMILGEVYRPGQRKNFVFVMYGLAAVLGFFVGIFFAGLVGQFLHWGWYFWIAAALLAVTLAAAVVSVPRMKKENKDNNKKREHVKMDWWGAVTIVSGLVLVVFAITQSAHAEHRWRTPYVLICSIHGVVLLCLAVYIEGWVAQQPLLPLDVFAVPCMTPLTISILLLYGTWGIFAVYGTSYFQNVMGATPLQVVAWYVPLGLTGIIFSVVEGLILHIVPGRALLVISGIGAVGSQLLLALIPEGASYWAWVFPATILSTIGIDVSTLLMTVFITTKLPRERQGLAGGLINSVLQLGIAFVLGPADIVQVYTTDKAEAALSRQSYKNVFWLGVGVGTVSLVLMTIWGNVPKAKSELTADERAELEREALQEATT